MSDNNESPSEQKFVPCSKCTLPRAVGKKCVPCHRESAREWGRKNPERIKARNAKWYAENREKAIAYSIEYGRTHPEQVYAHQLAWRRRNPDKIRAYSIKLAPCIRECVARYKKRHPDRALATTKKWAKANPEKRAASLHRYRARKRGNGGSYSHAEWLAIVKKQGGKCSYCSKTPKQLTADHVIPLCEGGTNYACNIVAACLRCNSKKNAKIIPGTQATLFDKRKDKAA